MAGPRAPDLDEVPDAPVRAAFGQEGGTAKRLRAATGAQGALGPLQGEGTQLPRGSKQRRLAAEALRGAGTSEALEVPHGLEGREHEAWLRWRLAALEREQGLRAELGRRTVRCWAPGLGAGGVPEQLRAAVEALVAEAEGLAELAVDAPLPPSAEAEALEAPVLALVEQHGLLVRAQQRRGAAAQLRVIGPPEAARDAAAILWARLAQGKSTALVLQVPGQLQSMPSQMSGDFEADLGAMEEEFEVQVHKYQTALWVAGDGDTTVASAKRTLQEMLQFYLPEGFLLLQGLKPGVLDQLRGDAELRALMARPDCAVALDAAEGTAWVCGGCCGAVRRLIESATEGLQPAAETQGEGFAEIEGTAAVGLPLLGEQSFEGPGSALGDGERWSGAQVGLPPALDSPSIMHVPELQELPPELLVLTACDGAPCALARAVIAAGPEAVWGELDPAGELLRPPGELQELSWAALEQFWAGMEAGSRTPWALKVR